MNSDVTHNKVGPVLRAGEIAQAAIEAIHEDNPGKEVHVEDRTAYVRVELEGECIIRRETMQEMLGRPFQMRELETVLGSFAGQIETTTDHVRFYYARKL